MSSSGNPTNMNLALAHAEARIRVEADEAVERLREYAALLAAGSSTVRFKYPYGEAADFIAIGNGHRVDHGLPSLPYRTDTDAYVACELLLDGEWHTPAEVHKALAESGVVGRNYKPLISSMLKDYALRRFGLRLEKRDRPTAYRIVQVEQEVAS